MSGITRKAQKKNKKKNWKNNNEMKSLIQQIVLRFHREIFFSRFDMHEPMVDDIENEVV